MEGFVRYQKGFLVSNREVLLMDDEESDWMQDVASFTHSLFGQQHIPAFFIMLMSNSVNIV
jgi:hypothetical protein